MSILKVKIVSKDYGVEDLLPKSQTEGSAGFDVRCSLTEDLIIKKNERVLIPTGISIAIESNKFVALVYPRSGLSIKKGLTLINSVGVIDSDYRGEIFCPMVNLSDEDVVIQPLERIAQIVMTPIDLPKIQVVDELDETKRGEGGFGSTGAI